MTVDAAADLIAPQAARWARGRAMRRAQVVQRARTTSCLGHHIICLVGAIMATQPTDPRLSQDGTAVAFMLGRVAALARAWPVSDVLTLAAALQSVDLAVGAGTRLATRQAWTQWHGLDSLCYG